jgi:hypothetical protein
VVFYWQKMKLFKVLTITVLLLLIVSVILWLVGGRRKLGEIFQQAPVYDVTGSWQVTANITTPYTTSGILLALLSQDESGRVSGTITDEQGDNSRQVIGQVTGNQFTTDPTEVIVQTMPPSGGDLVTYKVSVVFTGTIQDGNNRISGSITGELVEPYQGPLAGTFFADKTESSGDGSVPPPTNTPIPPPTNTPIPLPTNTPIPPPTNTPTPDLDSESGSGGIIDPSPTTTPSYDYQNNSAGSGTSTPSPTPYGQNETSDNWETPVTGNSFLTTLLAVFAVIGFAFSLSFFRARE